MDGGVLLLAMLGVLAACSSVGQRVASMCKDAGLSGPAYEQCVISRLPNVE
jgi:putative hemolysin